MPTDEEIEAGAKALFAYYSAWTAGKPFAGSVVGRECEVMAAAVLEAAEAVRPEPVGYVVRCHDGHVIPCMSLKRAKAAVPLTITGESPAIVCALLPVGEEK